MIKCGTHTIVFFYLALFHVQSYKFFFKYANIRRIFVYFFYVNMSKNIIFLFIERFNLYILKKSRIFAV